MGVVPGPWWKYATFNLVLLPQLPVVQSTTTTKILSSLERRDSSYICFHGHGWYPTISARMLVWEGRKVPQWYCADTDSVYDVIPVDAALYPWIPPEFSSTLSSAIATGSDSPNNINWEDRENRKDDGNEGRK